jgi:hypothetical protein
MYLSVIKPKFIIFLEKYSNILSSISKMVKKYYLTILSVTEKYYI